MLRSLAIGWCLMAFCVVIHAGGVTVSMKWLRRLPSTQVTSFLAMTWLFIRVAGWMILLHLVELTVWAAAYRLGDAMRSELASGTYRDPANVAPLAIYLLSDAARGINGQVFRVQGYEVSRLAMLAFDKTMTSLGPWNVEALGARLPNELGPTLTPLPVPWPEPKNRS